MAPYKDQVNNAPDTGPGQDKLWQTLQDSSIAQVVRHQRVALCDIMAACGYFL
jgi:hypothetical protein